MGLMASTYAPYAHRLTARSLVSERTWQRSSYPLFLVIASGVFIVSALALLLSQSGLFGARGAAASPAVSAPAAPAAATSPATPLPAAELETVLSYARAMQTDDVLVQVRPGVFAKRSNVQGVSVGGKTVYYDILPHQSYGPLRSGKVSESQVNVLARDAQGGFMVLVYTMK
jgi:hypothetical protein